MSEKCCFFWLHLVLQQNLTFTVDRTNMVVFFSISIVFICPLETFAAVFYLDAMDTSHCATI